MIRTRFAPSPTGRLHLGNARTALFNALLAAHAGGLFVLRVEDTDAERSDAAHEAALLEDLRWLGLEWSEGPDVGGSYAPYRQSRRGPIHARHFDRLRADGRAYPCFCTAEELAEQRRRDRRAGRPPRYPGTCARLPRAEANRRLAAGEPASLRFRVPPDRTVTYRDLVRGEQQVATGEIGDFVIRRTDGTPAFLFANAVDDALMGITHVLRGEDHASNTPRQLLLLEALGFDAPTYGHLPLVVDADGRPLSKRGGAQSLGDLRAWGIRPEALRNYLLRLGHAPAAEGLLDGDALARAFDMERLGRAPARYDPGQLVHWQRLALAAMDADDAFAWAGVTLPDPGRRRRLWALVRENVERPSDLQAWARALGARPVAGGDAAAVLAGAPERLFTDGEALASEADFKAVVRILKAKTELGGKSLFQPLRATLTGRLSGPELAAVWTYFTPAERAARFAWARSTGKDAAHGTP